MVKFSFFIQIHFEQCFQIPGLTCEAAQESSLTHIVSGIVEKYSFDEWQEMKWRDFFFLSIYRNICDWYVL